MKDAFDQKGAIAGESAPGGEHAAGSVPVVQPPKPLFGHMSGSVAEHGDLISPTSGETW